MIINEDQIVPVREDHWSFCTSTARECKKEERVKARLVKRHGSLEQAACKVLGLDPARFAALIAERNRAVTAQREA